MKICVVGMAKSGTSALYTAIKNKLPDDARCVFEPSSPQELQYLFAGTGDALTKIMFTSLNACEYSPTDFDKNVFIVRDPRDIIVSSTLYRFNRLTLINKTEKFNRLLEMFRQKEITPDRYSVIELLDSFEKGEAKAFRALLVKNYTDFLQFIEKVENHQVIKFEDFILNKVGDLEGYLGVDIKKPEQLEGWINKINRKGTSGDWRNWMTKKDVSFFSRDLDVLLTELDYEKDWGLAKQPTIDSEFCSKYILRLADARKMDPNIKSPATFSLELLKSAARDGKPVSLFRLGMRYLRGDGCAKNLMEAEHCLSKAVQLNHKRATFWLAECLRQQRKYKKAIQHFEDAGKQGVSRAHLKLGLIFEKNPKLKNPELSKKYYQEGATLGNAKCKEKLASL